MWRSTAPEFERGRAAGSKGQLSVELLPFVVISFILLLVFVMIVTQRLAFAQGSGEQARLQEIVLQLHDEVRTAAVVSSGYERNFTLPLRVSGKIYTIGIINNVTIIARTNVSEASTATFNVSGQPNRGSNTIRKLNGIINLN